MEYRAPKRIVTAEKALLRLLKSCSLSEKCSGDAKKSLQRWEISEKESKEIIDYLVENKYIDDSRYVELYIKDKTKFGGWGTRKIASTLRAKGLDANLVEKALSKSDKSLQKTKLHEVLLKKYTSLAQKESDKYKLRDKLFRFAASRGYEFEDVISEIEKICK